MAPSHGNWTAASEKHQEDARANILAGNQKIQVVLSTLEDIIFFRYSELISNSFCSMKTKTTLVGDHKIYSKMFQLLIRVGKYYSVVSILQNKIYNQLDFCEIC